MRVALRVWVCFMSRDKGNPDERDVVRLRKAAEGPERDLGLDDLAGHIVRREVKRRWAEWWVNDAPWLLKD